MINFYFVHLEYHLLTSYSILFVQYKLYLKLEAFKSLKNVLNITLCFDFVYIYINELYELLCIYKM